MDILAGEQYHAVELTAFHLYKGTLLAILKQCGVTREESLKLIKIREESQN